MLLADMTNNNVGINILKCAEQYIIDKNEHDIETKEGVLSFSFFPNYFPSLK